MKKHLLYITMLCGMSISFVEGSTNGLKDEFVIGMGDGYEERIGVQRASYRICPALKKSLSLSLQGQELKLTEQVNEYSLFSFGEVFEQGVVCTNHFSLVNNAGYRLSSINRNMCMIAINSKDKFQLQFKDDTGDTRPVFLQCNFENKKTPLVQITHKLQEYDDLWILEPMYKCLPLDQNSVDSQTLLFKIPTKEEKSNKMLSSKQILAFYELEQKDENKKINVVFEGVNYIFAYTPELFYITEGFYITSPSFPLQVSGIKDFSHEIFKISQETKKRTRQTKDSISLQLGQILFLKPSDLKVLNQGDIPLIGDIKVTPDEGTVQSSYVDPISFSLLLKHTKHRGKNSKQYQRVSIEFEENTIKLINIDKPLSVNNAGYILRNVIEEFGDVMSGKIVTPLALTVDKFGEDIKKASETAGFALVESSKHLSGAIKKHAETLKETLNEASDVFYKSIQKMSKEFLSTVDKTLKSLEKNTEELSGAIITASANMKDGAKEAAKEFSTGLNGSSSLIKEAFVELSKALKEGATVTSQSMNVASQKFKEGMNYLEKAAQYLQNIKIEPVEVKNVKADVEVCIIS